MLLLHAYVLRSLVPLWARAECKNALLCLFITLENKEFVNVIVSLSLSTKITNARGLTQCQFDGQAGTTISTLTA